MKAKGAFSFESFWTLFTVKAWNWFRVHPILVRFQIYEVNLDLIYLNKVWVKKLDL